MLEEETCAIDAIHVPVKRAKTLDEGKVAALAEDILQNGQKVPIRVRRDGDRFVLLEGLHRLEALRALGEDSVRAYVTSALLH